MTPSEQEVQRQLQICNACRYCEGFCAVFPAMTRRLSFDKTDVHYLANLCHNCGACLHACQYAPPHEFFVNIPQSMAKVRRQTYADYAWPRALGGLYQRNGLTLAVASAAALSLMVWLVSQAAPGQADNFYGVLPHNRMVALFAPVFLFAALALSLGVRRFCVNSNPPPAAQLPRWHPAWKPHKRRSPSSIWMAVMARAATTKTMLLPTPANMPIT